MERIIVYLIAVQLGKQGTKLADLPKGTAGPGRPKMARLQLARLPSITGYGSMQAILADSASRKVTYTHIHTWLKWIKSRKKTKYLSQIWNHPKGQRCSVFTIPPWKIQIVPWFVQERMLIFFSNSDAQNWTRFLKSLNTETLEMLNTATFTSSW